MSRKVRNRAHAAGESRKQSSLSTPARLDPSPEVASKANPETSVPSDDLLKIFEKAADRVKSDLTSKGKIRTMAFFAYDNGDMKVVFLPFKNDLQRDLQIERIREKALIEGACAVLALTEVEPMSVAMLSGETSGERASALLRYGFGEGTKDPASFKMSWVNHPAQNIFLEGIFDKKSYQDR
jgi:hypothetical protein